MFDCMQSNILTRACNLRKLLDSQATSSINSQTGKIMTDIVHPKKFSINGMYFQVTSHTKLSDSQAANIAMHFYRTHKFKKKDKGKLFTVMTVVNDDTASLF